MNLEIERDDLKLLMQAGYQRMNRLQKTSDSDLQSLATQYEDMLSRLADEMNK
jgi:hypothetical protein